MFRVLLDLETLAETGKVFGVLPWDSYLVDSVSLLGRDTSAWCISASRILWEIARFT